MNQVIDQMLEKYKLQSTEDYQLALREILQEIILLGLDRANFFEKAAFYGGTSLRILYGLDRFSEDLDFTLLKPDKSFKLDKYFSALEKELTAYGFHYNLERVEKSEDRLTESAFLKANTKLLFLKIKSTQTLAPKIQQNELLKIKFEVDVDPVTSFQTEIKTLYLPSVYTVKTLKLSSLFAGKMHAALLRNWRSRVKGRDFYDVQWYLARKTPLDRVYLEEKMKNSGALNEGLTREILIDKFCKRVENVDWAQAKADVDKFIKDKNLIKLWSTAFFKELIQKIELVG